MVTLSIITAIWNRAETLEHAIDSLEAQSYVDWEHIVQDGGSTDGTLALLAARTHRRRHVVSERDGGIYDALNRGLVRSKGDIVGILHSDDFLAHREVLSKVVQKFTETGADAIYGDLDYVAAEDHSRIIRHWSSGDFRPSKLAWGWMPPHPALFLRRNVFERFGTYDTSYRVAADYDAILRYFGKGGITSAHIPEVLVKMRVGGESNKSLRSILRKSGEDYWAIKQNGIGGLETLLWKNLRKFHQFFDKAR
jgi:glycosyltransferase